MQKKFDSIPNYPGYLLLTMQKWTTSYKYYKYGHLIFHQQSSNNIIQIFQSNNIHTQCRCTICKFEYLWNIITSSFEHKFTRFQRSSKSITRTRRTLHTDELKAAPTTARKDVDNIQVMHINDQPISDTV